MIGNITIFLPINQDFAKIKSQDTNNKHIKKIIIFQKQYLLDYKIRSNNTF